MMITKCRNDRLASLRTFYIPARESGEGNSKEADKNNKSERPREIFLGEKERGAGTQ